ncbi:hypothetical protein [Leucobacter sp. gxy201]|uniref:hypothetical protein n=1 Tax=Leucobacter sp. gxy201 TaxID=2957200 RepID=UPI003DA19F6C
MASESFLRLPQSVQDIVTSGLEAEIQDSFSRIESLRDQGGDENEIRFLEGDILNASALRKALTGEETPKN